MKSKKSYKDITLEDIKKIKLIVFDVDGILCPRGTKIKQKGDDLTIKIKRIPKEEIDLIKELNSKGFKIGINSGRGLYLLEKMFFEILPYISITYENGSATWYSGKIYQHFNSFSKLREVEDNLRKIKSKSIKAFEPKELIVTVHAKRKVKSIERMVKNYNELYCLWSGEAYDIGLKNKQTKANGIRNLIKIHKLKRENVLVIGDNYNDKEMFKVAGLSISADKKRVKGDFFIPLSRKRLPGERIMEKILKLV